VTAVSALIAMGSNLGDRRALLAEARRQLEATPGVTLRRASTIDETAPLGGLAQPMYLNQMLLVESALPPRDLLAVCHAIERAAGRDRTRRWSSRTLDLDLVRYGTLMCDLPDLSLPHPGIRDREFWAQEIAAVEQHG
jgi:2-amino-4-hydroxy-6-hydroxymethyldihydropteridine diphosphokinase